MAEIIKVGIIACSGEEIAAGTLSRLATRRVLESLRPQSTVTLCLPLFLAGDEQERRFAREHPTITVDGCDKLCARRGTEQHSGRVAASLVVSDILGDRVSRCHRSARDFDQADEQAVWLLADRIAAEVDALVVSGVQQESPASAAGGACCSCGGPSPYGTVEIGGKSVAVNGLPLILDHLRKKGLPPEGDCEDTLLETVKIYHPIEPTEEAAYRPVLVAAYRAYCRQASGAC